MKAWNTKGYQGGLGMSWYGNKMNVNTDGEAYFQVSKWYAEQGTSGLNMSERASISTSLMTPVFQPGVNLTAFPLSLYISARPCKAPSRFPYTDSSGMRQGRRAMVKVENTKTCMKPKVSKKEWLLYLTLLTYYYYHITYYGIWNWINLINNKFNFPTWRRPDCCRGTGLNTQVNGRSIKFLLAAPSSFFGKNG